MTTDTKQPTAGPSPDAPPDPQHDLKTLPMAEVQQQLESSADGLSQTEAAKRLTQYGPNEIAEHHTNALLKFLSYFWGPIPWMIEIAIVLSGVVGHWPDFFIILALLVANALVGYLEERQAGNAIDALKAKLAINARVRRDGEWVTPAARELVPGDVIRLRLGDIVPADARLLEGDEIEVDQSALTGESLPGTCASTAGLVTTELLPVGEVGIRRGDPVQAADGEISHVQGLVITRSDRRVSHVLLQESHLWGRKEVSIPISAVSTSSDGTRLNLTKDGVRDPARGRPRPSSRMSPIPLLELA